MEITIHITQLLAELLAIILALYAVDLTLKLISRFLDWRIKKLKNKVCSCGSKHWTVEKLLNTCYNCGGVLKIEN